MAGKCVYRGNEQAPTWCAKYARNMVCVAWCPEYKPRVRRCVDCEHGPQPYDVKRKCPVLKRVMRETDEACDAFEDRNLAGAYQRPPIDPCGEGGVMGEIQEYKFQRTYELTFLAFNENQAREMLREYELDMLKRAELGEVKK